MQTRLLATLAGGFLGAAVGSPISASLDLTPAMGLVGGLLAGLTIGYVGSILFDVFVAQPENRIDPQK